MPNRTPMRIAMIGSYVPRRCGIATFTHDLSNAIQGAGTAPEQCSVEIVAMNDRDAEYDYEKEVILELSQHKREDYRNAAEVLNTAKIDAVSLQHEYGLFGGESGDYLLDLLDRLQKPLISTPHSVLTDPTPKQQQIMNAICDKSDMVVVMANRARMILNEKYGAPLEKIKLIPHGVPDVPFGDTEPFKERFGLAGRPMILTFGLLGPGKGIETVLEALAEVAPDHPELAYVILGVTHPAVRRESGELYRISLELRAVELGIQKNVIFHNRYVSLDDLREYLQAADVYVTPYRHKEQITSGTLAYALAAGKAIISTPYWHAQELLVNGRGRLVDFGSVPEFSAALREMLEYPDRRKQIQKSAYDFGRSMVWSTVGQQYVEEFEIALRKSEDAPDADADDRKSLMRMSLPDRRLDHMLAMTDGTGILQHACYSTPDRNHGYCTDDNARAMIVAAMAWSLFQDEEASEHLQTYLSFLHYAQMPETGRFRNFMSYDRKWLESDGSDDCQGRAIWALGYLIAHSPTKSMQQLATKMFRAAVSATSTLRWPRAWALSVLGLHYYLRKVPDDNETRQRMANLAERLNGALNEHESDNWPWFEDVVTYDNGRIPQALIIAGHGLDRPEYTERGIRSLTWLLKQQTGSEGRLSAIGSNGWMPKNGERAKFDQQPLEPAALIGACKAAHRATGDSKWLNEMRRCFDWYIGSNDIGVSMIDFKTRGCFDGLEADGANQNQGAESVVSWLLSLLTMHEMQTGDAPDVG